MTAVRAIRLSADGTFCKRVARCGTAAMVSLVVDLIAARALMPMGCAVRRPLIGPIMAERRDRGRIGVTAIGATISARP